MRKILEIDGVKYNIIDEWEDNNHNRFVEYKDPKIHKHLINYLGICKRTRVIENCWRRWDKDTLIYWNPLTWIVIVLSYAYLFILRGIEGIKGEKNMFKPSLHSLYSYYGDNRVKIY